jgi:hypothetical protein
MVNFSGAKKENRCRFQWSEKKRTGTDFKEEMSNVKT